MLGIRNFLFIIFLGANLALTACSSSGPDEDAELFNQSGDHNPVSPDADDNTSTGDSPIYEFSVTGKGTASKTISVNTKDVLKIRVQPSPAGKAIDGTGYYPQYSQLGVYIKVGDSDQPTALLYNGFHGGNAQKGSVMDFSDAFIQTCDEDDIDCRQTVKIKVHNAQDDYWCLNFNLYCPYTHTYETHYWKVTLFVQTNDTDAL